MSQHSFAILMIHQKKKKNEAILIGPGMLPAGSLAAQKYTLINNSGANYTMRSNFRLIGHTRCDQLRRQQERKMSYDMFKSVMT